VAAVLEQAQYMEPQISELFVEGKCSPAVLDFLRSTGVGRAVPREDGENEEDQDGASESFGAED